MTDFFKLPISNGCLYRNGNLVYDYRSGSVRDTYELINFKWQKIATQNYNTIPAGAVCLTSESYLLPSDVAGYALIGAFAVALCFLGVVWSIFRR